MSESRTALAGSALVFIGDVVSSAPAEILSKTNPLPNSDLTIQVGKNLFLQNAQPVPCAMCHGDKGSGEGVMGATLIRRPETSPAPR